ncbi:UPF0182 family protein [Rhizohabitans arisaemae]|uniref:UPF0182 family protein n=1 Tax=Rhizohabitans arisaemae TaxID=2720610 RepID=UPI0024B0E29D|nr:UPF0182 family protein [Rhizohabitans arisaemae]
MSFRTSGAGRPRLNRRSKLFIPVLIALAVLVGLFLIFANIWTDLLWFRSVDYQSVFSTMLLTQVVLFLLGGLLMAGVVGGNMLLAYRLRPMFGTAMFGQQGVERYRLALDPHRKLILYAVMGALAFFAGTSAAGQWTTWLQFVNRTPFGVKDQQFGLDISFFTFTYPFIRMVLGFLFAAVIVSAIMATIIHYVYGGFRLQNPGASASRAARVHLSVLLGTFVLLKAIAYWVDRYGLAFSEAGRVHGPSYTDVNAVLPAKTILAFIALLCAALFFAGVVRRGGMIPGVSFGLLVLSAVLVGGVYPALVEQFQVKPNQQSKEAPFIKRNIDATRAAYGIDKAQVTNYSAKTEASESELQSEAATIPGVRLLDPSRLSPTFQQLQQIRGYYRFPDQLDIDRYNIDGQVRDTVVSVREIGTPPTAQQNWINSHLVYTHGFGFVAAPGNQVDANGRPNFVEKDIPPAGQLGKFEPRIYFGENSPVYSVVGAPKSAKPIELDYPDDAAPNGQVNYTYTGKGGVPMGSFFNQLLYAIKFGEKNMLLSSDINEQSRIMYTRQPRERIKKVAPFLTLDSDPYPAIVGGRIVWIVDAYTTSDAYPYSQRKSLRELIEDVTTDRRPGVQLPNDNVNYIRNAVKATVDAYDGTVSLYQWDEKDAVLKTWMSAFPGVVKPFNEISAELKQHLRYPEDLFKAQREMLANYHVTDPNAFYIGQDFWKVPADPSSNKSKQPPYYITLRMPGSTTPTFSLTSTFVPNGRQNMAAFMAVDATAQTPDAKLQILQLPSATTIQGPEQAQNTFLSDPRVSSELNLLRGQQGAATGTDVLYGNLLTLPFGGGLLYVEPIYVQPKAETSGRYPTLQRVLVLFGSKVGFGPTFQDALAQVFGTNVEKPPTTGQPNQPPTTNTPPSTGQAPAVQAALQKAQAAYTAGQEALKKGDFTAYGKAQADLKAALDELDKALKAQGTPAPSPTGSPGPTPTGSPSPTPGAAGTPSPSPTTG